MSTKQKQPVKAQASGQRKKNKRRQRGNQRPKKTWGDKKLPADELMKLAGAHGTNSLASAHREKNAEVLGAINQDVVCDVTPATTTAAIQSFARYTPCRKEAWS